MRIKLSGLLYRCSVEPGARDLQGTLGATRSSLMGNHQLSFGSAVE